MHRESKRLDCAGQVNLSKSWFLANEDLMSVINFELQNSSYERLAGSVWQ